MKIILYIHGMGGGADSRIPSILNGVIADKGIRVVVRTYDFDPSSAHEQISSWVEELCPALIIGESLGCIHAIRIKNIPHLLISPALGGPLFFSRLAWLAKIPGIPRLMGHIYRPREGERQALRFSYDVLRRYGPHYESAILNTSAAGSGDYFYAFIGRRDHYRRSGVVSIRAWKKYFGETYTLYDGTHFTEEKYIHSLIIPKILELI